MFVSALNRTSGNTLIEILTLIIPADQECKQNQSCEGANRYTREKIVKDYCCKLCATLGFDPGGEDFDTGPETRHDHQSMLCTRILLKYKRDREASDIVIRRGQNECLLASF